MSIVVKYNPFYIIPRFIRRHLPPRLFRFLMDHDLIVKAGTETSQPLIAVKQYQEALQSIGQDFSGKELLIFGYGGFLGTACELLRLGAKHVYLYDKYAKLNRKRNQALLVREEYQPYLKVQGAEVLPESQYISMINEDLGLYLKRRPLHADLVLSTWVWEHVENVEETLQALSALSYPEGVQVHFIDLRDHFFRYPFQMLCYEDKIWNHYLNSGDYLNRLRVNDYEKLFKKYFQMVEIRVTQKQPESFKNIKPHIRPEFLTGNDDRDSATEIALIAQKAKPLPQFKAMK